MIQLWQNIVTNFHGLMEDPSTGLPSSTSIVNAYHEADDIIDFRTANQPSSITNGSYSTVLQRVNNIKQDLATGITDFDYNVLLLLCHELNISDDKKFDYNNLTQDIEEIIRRRLNFTSYENSSIIEIDFILWNQIRWLVESQPEKFGITELLFQVKGRANLL